MDKKKATLARRNRVALAPNLEVLEGRRLLAARASQVTFQEVPENGSTELIITGTNKADIININDNGTGTPGNITVTLGNGTTYTSQAGITLIEVLGKGGNDQVTYNLTGTLVAPESVLVDLGAGNDQFTANVTGAVENGSTFEIEALGDSGNDNLTVNQSGPILSGVFFPYLDGGAGNDTLTYNGTGNISAGASVSPGLSGGAGNDTISSTYTGQIDGNYIYNLSINGGTGNDKITDNVNVEAGSTGTVGNSANTPAIVEGGGGNDQILFAVVVDPSDTQFQVNAYAVGNGGRDVVQRTANVLGDPTNESDTIIT